MMGLGLLLVLGIGLGIYSLIKSNKAPETNNVGTTLEYLNADYGFSFSLPSSWQGFTVINNNWEGTLVENSKQKMAGPEIIIRHPLYTESNPRQDIPIMIFKFAEWDLIQQEKLAVSAAPIGPSELGRNNRYIFALPARYNYAFPNGFEEVDKIIQGKPLKTFDLLDSLMISAIYDQVENFHLGESLIFPDRLTVTLKEINDSRCRTGVQCIWAGELSALLEVKQEATITELRLGSSTKTKEKLGQYTFTLTNIDTASASIMVSK